MSDTIDAAKTIVEDIASETPKLDFITVFLLAVLVLLALIYVVCSCRSSRPKHSAPRPKRPKLEYQFLTKEELKNFDGNHDENAPVFVAIRGKIYDVSSRKDMYGKGGGYNLFAGLDASRALAKSSFEKADIENCDLSDLSFVERDTLAQWEMTFSKYDVVGEVVANDEEKKHKQEEYAARKAAAAASANPAPVKSD